MMRADRVSGAALLVFAAAVMYYASALPSWSAEAPGPGFLPFWLGVLLACLAVPLLAGTHGPGTHVMPAGPPPRAVAVVVALTAAAAALALAIGLVLATGVFAGAVLAYLRPHHRAENATAAVLTPLVVWLVFARWLGVPLPAGPLGF
jgi:putative tricarboxylic transport membrane protein